MNAADLNVVRRHLGTSAAVFGTGDADRDGDVDAADLRAVRRAMGAAGGAAPAVGLSENPAPTAVPEPTAAWVILAAGALLRPRRRLYSR